MYISDFAGIVELAVVEGYRNAYRKLRCEMFDGHLIGSLEVMFRTRHALSC